MTTLSIPFWWLAPSQPTTLISVPYIPQHDMTFGSTTIGTESTYFFIPALT